MKHSVYCFFLLACSHALFCGHITGEFIESIGLTPQSNVLEIGCAGGDDAATLAEFATNGSVVAIDESPFQIDTAKKTYFKQNLLFRTLNPLDLDYSGDFDAIVSFSALHWVDNHGELLERVFQALKSDGVLYFEMPNGLPETLQIAMQKALETDTWSAYKAQFEESLTSYSTTEYRDMLHKTGFVPTEIFIKEKTQTFTSKNNFIRFLIRFLPQLQNLPLGKRMHFLNEVLVHYFATHPIEPDGSIYFPIRTLSVHAVKHG